MSCPVQFMPLIHPFTHTFTHQRRLAAMQGTDQLVRSNWGSGVLLRDNSTRPGWDRTGNPPTARRLLLPPEPHRPTVCFGTVEGGIHKDRFRSTEWRRVVAEGSSMLFLTNGMHPKSGPQMTNQPWFSFLLGNESATDWLGCLHT